MQQLKTVAMLRTGSIGTGCKMLHGTPADSATVEIPLSKGFFALVSPEDYGWLTEHKWCALVTPRKTYAVRKQRINGKQFFIYMHRQILGEPDSHVDHWDTDGLHNWRENLRCATRSQNQGNTGLSRQNTSGYKGVSLVRSDGIYVAAITVPSQAYSSRSPPDRSPCGKSLRCRSRQAFRRVRIPEFS